MKIAISGPPGKKNKVIQNLAANKFFTDNEFAIQNKNLSDESNIDSALGQFFIFNEIIKETFANTPAANSIHKFSVIDPVATYFTIPQMENMSRGRLVAMANTRSRSYDYIFCVGNIKKHEGYKKIPELFPFQDNIVYLDGSVNKICNEITNTTKERLEKINAKKLEDSNKWFSAFRKDYSTQFPSSSS